MNHRLYPSFVSLYVYLNHLNDYLFMYSFLFLFVSFYSLIGRPTVSLSSI